MDTEPGEFCPRCQIGRLHLRTATYLQLYRGMMISVPDTPAYICDFCNYQEFEFEAVHQLQALIGQPPPASDAPPRPVKTTANDSQDGAEQGRLKP
ncbi:MAG: hypothetical protein SF029_19120 [bacterium]|nr:hypothetical protein [bacterium]